MSPDDNLTDSIEAIEAIRTEIFSLPLLPQKQAVDLFIRLDRSLQQSIHLLLDHTNFVEQYLSNVIAEVAGSVTHGRTIYETQSNRGQEPPSSCKVFKKRSDLRFLEQAIHIIRMLAAYDRPNILPYKQHTKQVLGQIRFARLVYEDVLRAFQTATVGYGVLASTAAQVHAEMHKTRRKKSISRQHDRYAELHDSMLSTEQMVGVDRAYLYHVCVTIDRQYQFQLRLRDAIYGPYLRIVYKEARKHATNTQQILDNVQNGSQGLLRAISCYNLEKGVSFSSYAHWWIRQAILFHIKESSNFMKLPVTTWQTFTSIEKHRSRIAVQTGDDTIESLANETGHTVEKLKNVYESVRSSHVHSLDYEVDDTGKLLLIDVIPDQQAEENERRQSIEDDIRTRLDRLPEVDRFIMLLHYGITDLLRDHAPLTMRDVLIERVRQRLAASSTFAVL